MQIVIDDSVDKILSIAWRMTAEGRHNESECLLRDSINKYPQSDHIWYELVCCIERQDKKLEGFFQSTQWVTCCPDSFMARVQNFTRSLNFCHWARYDYDVRYLLSQAKTGFFIGECALTVPAFSNDLLSRWVANYSQALTTSNDMIPASPQTFKRQQDAKIRVGFLGKDFYNQATNYLMIGFVEAHNRECFEFIAYDFGRDDNSWLRERAVNAYDQFRYLENATNHEIAEIIRSDSLDVLLFIQSNTSERVSVLASRPAPIQLAYLYFPGPFNLSFFDGIVADDFVIPDAFASSYNSNVWRISGCYQPNDDQRYVPEQMTKSSVGIHEKTFVFANFNDSFKVNPFSLNLWAEILKACPESILMLLGDDDFIQKNLLNEFSMRGVSANRIMFTPKVANCLHLERLTIPDLILDTFPYGGHTLTSDALWSGTPVLTLCGETFASRVAGSLLKSVSLEQLITTTPYQYVHTAIEVYRSNEWARGKKQYLSANRRQFDVFNPIRYARAFEHMIYEIVNSSAVRRGVM